jgi:membrane protein implicated in regulation of membrane protease activity
MTQELWPYYVIIGIVMIGLEMVVSGFFLLPVGVGFLISGIFSLFIDDRSTMHLITAVMVMGSLFVFRKYFKKSTLTQKNPVEDLIGREIVLENDPHNEGRVYGKIYGESWALVPQNPQDIFISGEAARIVAMDGNKLVIKKI